MHIVKAPPHELKVFLAQTITKMSGLEKLESQKLAKLLMDKHKGSPPFSLNRISESFSWLHKIGVLDFERKYERSGGWRLFLFRKCGELHVEDLIMDGDDHHLEDTGDSNAQTSAPKHETKTKTKTKSKPKPKPKPKPKHGSDCCDNKRVVKSKKTGKRFCKNCKAPYPEKGPDASASKSSSSCCDNPHPVKSKKTGKRRCKNCGTPLESKRTKTK